MKKRDGLVAHVFTWHSGVGSCFWLHQICVQGQVMFMGLRVFTSLKWGRKDPLWVLEHFASQQEELEKINSQWEETEKMKLPAVSKQIVKAKSRMFFCQCPSSALPEQFWLWDKEEDALHCWTQGCSAARWSGQPLPDVLVGWEMQNTHWGLVCPLLVSRHVV